MSRSRRSRRSRRIEYLPEELIHHIQSRLPVKEAARTSMLSKSWRHAWSTIPTLRFSVQERKDFKVVYRILFRYLRQNIPIKSFDLDFNLKDKKLASLAKKCIRTMATKTCTLKELSLSFDLTRVSFDLPYEILSCENLTKMYVSNYNLAWFAYKDSLRMTSHDHVIIKCVSLRELYLDYVNISQELLDGILSSCRSLVKVMLFECSRGLNTIKVKNLPCLEELSIVTEDGGSTALEINHVPNLCFLNCYLDVPSNPPVPFNAHSITLGSRLTQLRLNGVVTDDESLDLIISGVPFLEDFTLFLQSWKSERCHFTCASIKGLSLLMCSRNLIDVNVHAPNLQLFSFEGCTMPTLLFPVSTLFNQTRFNLKLTLPVDASFFLKMREALALSSNCEVNIILDDEFMNQEPPRWNITIDDLRTRLRFPPATNVQELSFQYECFRKEHSPFFDAFFEICHPSYVTVTDWNSGENNFCMVMLREFLENKTTTMTCWPRYLKQVQIKRDKKWKTLKTSHIRFLDGSTGYSVDFKLEWRP